MKAIRIHQFGDPSVMQLQDVPDPQPGAGQVVVRLHAIGVNPVETYIRTGIYGPRTFPFTPGADGAGVVDSVGPDVTRVKTGQRVYLNGSVTGTYAERAPCEIKHVHALPDDVSFAQGAAIGVPVATAYRALVHRAQARAGETVLVHGATGGVGTAAVQFARALGMTVIATGGTEQGRALVKSLGAHHVLDHHDPARVDRIMDLTNRKGVDVVLEMLANVNLATDLTLLAKFGRVVVIGSRGPAEILPRDTMSRDADIRGMTLFNVTDTEMTSIHAAIAAAMECGTLKLIVDEEIPLAQAARAHEEVMKNGSSGKIVMIP